MNFFTKLIVFISATILGWSLGTLSLLAAEQPTVRLNEIAWMGTETSGNDEWIELYNTTEEAIDLTGWTIRSTDGSPEITLEGSVEGLSFFILERTDDESVPYISANQIYSGSLSNSGEQLQLRDANSTLIDQVQLIDDNWPAGDNITKQTMERDSQLGWQTSELIHGTPGEVNSSKSSGDTDDTNDTTDDQATNNSSSQNSNHSSTRQKVLKYDIVISELFPNPTPTSTQSEFIELQNISKKTIPLDGWKIVNSLKKEYILPPITMKSDSIIVLSKKQTKLPLLNDKDTISLYSESGKLIDKVSYKNAPLDVSWQRNSIGDYQWHVSTYQEKNNLDYHEPPISIINGPTEARLYDTLLFDASDSFTTDDSALTFTWEFGDGGTDQGSLVHQTYLIPNTYTIILTTTASTGAVSSTTHKVIINEAPLAEDNKTTTTTDSILTTTTTPQILGSYKPLIFISEFLPNPEGADAEGEYIELVSHDSIPIDISGWQLDDQDGGSKPYIIPSTTYLRPQQHLAFYRTETNISLNNSDDAVRLFDATGNLVDMFEYESSKEGQSYSLDSQYSFVQSENLTPGQPNEIPNLKQPGEQPTTTKPIATTQTTNDSSSVTVSTAPPQSSSKTLVIISALVAIGTLFTVSTRNRKPTQA